MTIRKLIATVLLALAPVLMLPSATPAQTVAPSSAITDVLQATAFDQIFAQFGATFEQMPAHSPVPFPPGMAEVWRQTARDVFAAESMQASLAKALDGRLSVAEAATIMDFFTSPLGRRISATDRALLQLEPDAQQRTIAEGEALIAALETDSRRREQIDEMLLLASADISVAMAAQSLRGMVLAMALASQRGDIAVPWEEIDAQLEALMAGVEAEIAATQRAAAAVSTRELSEAELDAYLDFLRTDAARKFYGLTAVAAGSISGEAMVTFGETLAAKLSKLDA